MLICTYMVYIDGKVIFVCPSMLLVAYYLVCHCMNVCAIVICIHYMFVQISYMYKFIYVLIYMTFISLHPPSYNGAKMHFLSTCAVKYDDLCSSLFILVTFLLQSVTMFMRECPVIYCAVTVAATVMS